MSKDRPVFSRCPLGKSRWFWLAYRSWEALVDGEGPLATGYAPSAQEAEQAAGTAAPGAEHYGNGTAAYYHRQLCVKRRAAKPASNHTGTTVQEFLYTDWLSEYDTNWQSCPHLVVKQTRKLIFVEKNNYCPDPWDRHAYALNRAELETNGSAWSPSAREYFHTTPYEQRRQHWVSPELAVLGLKVGASKQEVKAAYRRLARQHHPDCGGDPAMFKAIHAAYEQAMAR